MRTGRGPSSPLRRAVGASVVVLLGFVAMSQGASADHTEGKLRAARERLARLEDQITAQQARLDALEEELNVLAGKIYEAQNQYDEIQGKVMDTRRDLARTRARLERLQDRLDDRAREAYIQGPAGTLELILSATSLTDLSDRVVFVDQLVAGDADLAAEVSNRAAELEVKEADLEHLLAQQAVLLAQLADQKEELDAKFAEQQRVASALEDKRREAAALVEKLRKQLRQERLAYLRSLIGGRPGDGPFFVCPVDIPRAYSDSFGAPRVGHLHAGVDIFAPYGTPVRAPFDGRAVQSYSGLGGLAVYVYGAEGYVYNAHLSGLGTLGEVDKGEIVGYVGTSGNAQGTSPHDHFEWHPNVVPEAPHVSPYGFSVLGSAIDPYPYLLEVC